MKKRLLSRLHLLLSVLFLSVAFQSCNKEEEDVAPLEAVASANSTVLAPKACKTVCLISRNRVIGSVDVAQDDSFLYLTYNITAPNISLRETNFDVFSSLTQLTLSGKLSLFGVVPSRFAYSKCWTSTSRITTYTAAIPRKTVDYLCRNNTFFITAYARLSNGESAWASPCEEKAGCVTLSNSYCFPGKIWGAFFKFSKDECTNAGADEIDFTYAWEDMMSEENDADYNDLVIKSAVNKYSNRLDITFTAAARGAHYDHAFRFNIAKAGVVTGGITGAASVEDKGTYYTVTVFPSTKAILPPTSPGDFANTVSTAPCIQAPPKTVSIAINSTFRYDAARPYEPFISVYTAGDATTGTPNYDLYIYEVSKRDTWTSTSGAVFPNGILIPADWKWPLERTIITEPYPNFTSISAGFTTNWADNLADPYKVSSCN